MMNEIPGVRAGSASFHGVSVRWLGARSCRREWGRWPEPSVAAAVVARVGGRIGGVEACGGVARDAGAKGEGRRAKQVRLRSRVSYPGPARSESRGSCRAAMKAAKALCPKEVNVEDCTCAQARERS